ncbi:MAG TPA: DUF4386 domain-containing protein [Solirubrobacteraceae bacterium]
MPQHPSFAAEHRSTARLIGVFFLLTFATSIGAYALYGSVLDDTRWVVGSASDTEIRVGALLEVLLVVFDIATAVVLYPLLRRFRPTLALGWVASRIVESTLIAVGAVSLLSVATLHGEGVGSEGARIASAQAFVAAHDWTFLLGPGFCVAIGNGLLLGYAMLRSGLLPARLAMIGLVGGSLCLVNAVGALFGAWGQMSATGGLLSLAIMVWEAGVLGVHLIVKGFREPAATTGKGASRWPGTPRVRVLRRVPPKGVVSP